MSENDWMNKQLRNKGSRSAKGAVRKVELADNEIKNLMNEFIREELRALGHEIYNPKEKQDDEVYMN